MKKFLTATTALMILTSPFQSFAASEDDEISIMAAEQRIINSADVTVNDDDDIETFNDNSKNTQPENENTETNNRDISRSIINPDIDAANIINKIESDSESNNSNNMNTEETNNQNTVESIDNNLNNNVGLPNPIVTYANFEDAAKKVGFIPLYIPKKSGYSMNYIAVIGENLVEIRYGRRWEPNVKLTVRTYKRSEGEPLKDISGVYGVKWRIDPTSGTTIYVARVSDNTNVAAWAVGKYTFAAMTENLSFAAFHAIVVEELVDLCNHYFFDLSN